MDARKLISLQREQLRELRAQVLQALDAADYALEAADRELAAAAVERQHINLDLKSEAEFAAELGVCVDTLRRHRQELPLGHVRACNTSIMYTAEQRAAACAALTRPRKRT